jgi:hypothetical protein
MEEFISFITRNLLGFSFYFDLNISRQFLFSVLAGLYLKILFSSVSSQYWLRTYTHTLVFGLLPPIGFLITTVISNSIALSLGMIGALSVIRFRTPVKNPLELVMYFMLITLGIVISVQGNFALHFLILVTVLLGFVEIYSYFTKGKSYEFFKESEEYVLNLILVKNEKFSYNNIDLIHESHNNDQYMFTFKSKDLNYLQEIKESVGKDNLISYSIDK